MKIKKIFLLAACLFIFKWSSAQTDSLSFQKNHFIFSISTGMTMPLGEFRNYSQYINDFTDNYPYNLAGLAENGFDGKIQVTYLMDDIGIIATYLHSENKANSNDEDIPVPGSYNPYLGGGGGTIYTYGTIETYYATKTWYTNNVLVGVVLPVVKTKWISLDFKMSVGFQQAISPATEMHTQSQFTYGIHGTDSTSYNSITSNSKIIQPALISKNFVFDSGIDYNFNLTKKLSVGIGIDCLLTQANFSGNVTTYTSGQDKTYYGIQYNPNTVQNQTLTFQQNITLLCFNIGASYAIK